MDNLPDIPRRLVPAVPEDIPAFARSIRDEHLREIAAAAPFLPEDAVRLSLQASLEAYSYRNGRDDVPIFMMGVEAASPITGGAMVWMLGRKEVDRNPAGVMRAARWGIGRAYGVTGARFLEQAIPNWYRVGVAFARRLGFQVTASSRAGWCRVVHDSPPPIYSFRNRKEETPC